MEIKRTLTLICPACKTHQTFQSKAEALVCPSCGWKGAFLLPVKPPKKSDKKGQAAKRSFNERIRDITIEKTSRGYRISWHTFTWQNLILVLFTIVWGSLIYLIYEWMKEDPTNINMMVFLVFYMLVWAVMGYSALALMINRVILLFDRKNMSRRHDPLPFIGEFEMPLEFIHLFYAEGLNKKQSKDQQTDSKPAKNERVEMLLNTEADSYRLIAVLLSGREISLFSHFSNPEILFFLQEQISAWLEETNAAQAYKQSKKTA